MVQVMAGDSAKSLLYRRVADRIRTLIEAGTLRPGDRIPSVRQLSGQMTVSISTVLEAYRLLEDGRFIEARPQSGYYVRRTASAPPTPERTRSDRVPLELEADSMVLRLVNDYHRPGVLPLGAAIPSPEFFPTARLNRILAQVVRNDPNTSQSYDATEGREALRIQIARRLLEAGLSIRPDEVMITSGAQEAVSLSLRAVTRPGDAVAVETPTYYGMLEALRSLHLRVLEIGTDARTGICLDDLEDAVVRKRIAACVLVPTFGNPLGHTMPAERKQHVVELLARHDVPLIEDDVYGELAFAATRPPAAKAFDREGLVLLCSSFSKTLAPGYRIGWVVPGRFQTAVQRLKFSTSIATATPTQMAVASYLESGGFERHLRRLRRIYRDQMRRMTAALVETLPEGARVSHPEGGHVLWVEMPRTVDALELYDKALARGISIAPGPVFSASNKYRNFLRVNCAIPWSPRVDRAIDDLGELIRAAV